MTPASPPFFTPYGSSRDDDRGLAAAQLFDVRPRSHDDAAAAGPVRLADPLAAEDDPAGREVRALDVLAQTLDVDVRVVDHRHHPVDHLGEVVRRDVGRHADGDPRGSVDEQVGEPRREDRGLAAALVVVGDEVDGVRVDVAEQLGRDPREACLGVAHRRGGVVVDVPEVPLRVDERIAHRERLRHANEGVVDGRVAMRVVVLHHVADDARRLHPRPIRLQAALLHRIEDPAVHRLEPVAHVWKGARDDDAHRVVQEARAHLLLELAAFDAAGAEALEIRHRGSARPGRFAR